MELKGTRKMLPQKRQKVIVFGLKDTFCGQIVNSKQFKSKFKIAKILTEEIPNIDEAELHKKNPVQTCEYARNKTIFGAEILEGESAWRYLRETKYGEQKSGNISGVLILEDQIIERRRIYEKIKEEVGERFKILTWVSETAIVDESAKIGEGSIIAQNCYVGYKAEVGKSVIMQTSSLLEHHSKVGNFINICPGFVSGSFINIEDEAQINIGVTVFNRVSIGKRACIGAGSLVTKDCDGGKLYFGRPAKYQRTIANI